MKDEEILVGCIWALITMILGLGTASWMVHVTRTGNW